MTTTSPTHESMPHILCEVERHLCDSTNNMSECILEGVSEPPPHRECEVVDRACEAISISNNLIFAYIVSSHLVIGPKYDNAPIRDDYVLPLDKTMAMVECDAPPHGSIKMKMTTIWSLPPHLHHMSGMRTVT